MKEKIETIIKNAIASLYGVNMQVTLTSPPDGKLGDYASNIAFRLAQQVHQSPLTIAQALQEALQEQEMVLSVNVVAPGFLNIQLKKELLVKEVLHDSISPEFLLSSGAKGIHMSIEHTAANPNKHLHVGHLRNFTIGDTLVRLFKKTGYDVSVQYIYNDQGLQIAKVIWGFSHLEQIGISKMEESMKFDSYAARIYVAAEKYLAEHKECEDEVRNIIQKMEEGGNDISNYSEEITIKILLGQLQTIEAFGVYYDQLVTETSMTQSGELEKVIGKLLETGKVFKESEGKNEGCIVIKGLLDEKGHDLPDKVLIRADGTAVYTAKDIVLALWKFGLLGVHFNFKELVRQSNGVPLYLSVYGKEKVVDIEEKAAFHINVVDERQSFAMDVVKESLRVLGYPNESKKYFHLGYDMVSLSKNTARQLGLDVEMDGKSVAMSGRKGIEVTIDDLLEKVTNRVIEKSKQKDELLEYLEAQHIAAGALRFYMAKFSYNTVVVFDIEDALSTEGNSGIYLMYAYVRAKKILQKTGKSGDILVEDITEIPDSLYAMLLHMSYGKSVLQNATKDFAISAITEYTYEMAKLFSNFYHDVPVKSETDPTKRALYIQSVEAFENLYGQFLDILGITTPEHI